MRLEPCPGRVDDGQIAAQGSRSGLIALLTAAGVIAEGFSGAAREKLSDQVRIGLFGVGALQQGEIKPSSLFFAIPLGWSGGLTRRGNRSPCWSFGLMSREG